MGGRRSVSGAPPKRLALLILPSATVRRAPHLRRRARESGVVGREEKENTPAPEAFWPAHDTYRSAATRALRQAGRSRPRGCGRQPWDTARGAARSADVVGESLDAHGRSWPIAATFVLGRGELSFEGSIGCHPYWRARVSPVDRGVS